MAKAQSKKTPTDTTTEASTGLLMVEHHAGCSCSQCDCKHCGGAHQDDSIAGASLAVPLVDLRHIVKMSEQRDLGILSTRDLDVSVICLQPGKVSNLSAYDGDRVYIVERGEGRVQVDLAWTSVEKGDLFVVPADSAFVLSAESDRALKLVVIAAVKA